MLYLCIPAFSICLNTWCIEDLFDTSTTTGFLVRVIFLAHHFGPLNRSQGVFRIYVRGGDFDLPRPTPITECALGPWKLNAPPFNMMIRLEIHEGLKSPKAHKKVPFWGKYLSCDKNPDPPPRREGENVFSPTPQLKSHSSYSPLIAIPLKYKHLWTRHWPPFSCQCKENWPSQPVRFDLIWLFI